MIPSTHTFLLTIRSQNARALIRSTACIKNNCFRMEASTCKMNPEVKSDGISLSTELKIPVSWGYIAAKQWGNNNGKPVLAVHGWQDNAGSFDKLAPLLPKDWNLVCIDLPGHGQSSHFPNGFVYYALEYITAIKEVTSFFKWDKFDYLGHSMGSGIGYLYSAIFPESVRCFVSLDLITGLFVDVSKLNLQTELARFVQDRMRFHKEYDKPAPIYPKNVAIKKVTENLFRSLTEESGKILLKRGAEILPDDMVRFTRDRRLVLPISIMSTLSMEQVKTLVKSMKCNLLIIKGKQGLWYDKAEIYEDLKNLYAKYCKTFKYIEVEGTHHVHLNNPERVADYIIEFIK